MNEKPEAARTLQDYAIEHAEYMAVAGEHMITAVNALGLLQQTMDDGDAVDVADFETAKENVTEMMRGLREGIYEFRKRRNGRTQPGARRSAQGTDPMTPTSPKQPDANSMKPILCLDFDGVIHSYSSRWQGAAVIPDPPVHGALEFIVNALKTYEVHIFSSRSHQWGGKRAMKRWLRDHLIDLGAAPIVPRWWSDVICANHHMEPWHITNRDCADDVVRQIKWPWFKPPAKVTIDDRAITFTGTWPSLSEIDAFRPWNKPVGNAK